MFFFHQKHIINWKADRYIWRDKGHANVPGKNLHIRVHYYECVACVTFQRRATIVYKDPSIMYDSTTIVHYVGSSEDIIALPRGNCHICK